MGLKPTTPTQWMYLIIAAIHWTVILSALACATYGFYQAWEILWTESDETPSWTWILWGAGLMLASWALMPVSLLAHCRLYQEEAAATKRDPINKRREDN